MAHTTLDGADLKELFTGGMANLKLNAAVIDELNVFPIPDGDTGNNMMMTIEGGVRAVADSDTKDVCEFSKKFARGALLGARGNSGVILSQFFRGFSIGCEGMSILDTKGFAKAMKAGVDRAYEAVITPTEGTILTVMREGWEYLAEHEDIQNFDDLFKKLNVRMDDSLEHTPDLLPILKESGVIDSGGAGLLCIFRGMEKTINGEKIEGLEDFSGEQSHSAAQSFDASKFNADTEMEFGYCTEFILQLQNAKVDIPSFDIKTIISYLESIGNSIVAIKDDDLVKVHVHTFTPGKVLNFVQQFGEFITLKIENMMIQHNENSMFGKEGALTPPKAEHKQIAVVTVVNGEGLRELFTEIGVDICVDGGQTENPSTEDFLSAFEKLDADDIIVLPGNSNIVMASTQAAELYTAARVHVVKAKTIAEVYSAISMMDLTDGDCGRVIDEMESCIENTKTGLITTAIRDVDYENISVKKGHYIGLDGHQILSDSEDRIDASIKLLKATEDIGSKDVISIFYGENVTEDEIERLGEAIEREFGWVEYGFINGGQKVYDYIFSIE